MNKNILKNDRIWKIYTRNEEYNPLVLDRFNRFNYYASSNKNILEPMVSRFLMENGSEINYPDGKKFAVCLTHDVDKVFLYWKARCSNCLKELARLKFNSSIKGLFRRNPYLNFREIMDIENRYNARSSFYILTTNRDILNDPLYDAKDLEDELKHVIDQGWEVGLHGGYYSYNNFGLIKYEKERLEKIIGKTVVGYRNHFLRFSIPRTWELLSHVGFKYDTTLGFADMVGFRNGMCYPFKPFDLNENKKINILEIPLAISDGALFSQMHLDFDESWKICKKIIDNVIAVNGVVTVSWHNTSFDEVECMDMKRLYDKILKYSYERNGWLTSGEKIWKHVFWKNPNMIFGINL